MHLLDFMTDLLCRSNWILNTSSLKIKLNHNWKFQKNWDVHVVLLEISQWTIFYGIYFIRFGLLMWNILIFKLFLSLKIKINYQKTSIGRKYQLRMWSHLQVYHSIQVWFLFIFDSSKMGYIPMLLGYWKVTGLSTRVQIWISNNPPTGSWIPR